MSDKNRATGNPWLSIILPLALLAVIFGWFIPTMLDYSQVWAAVSSLAWQITVLMVVMGVVGSFLEGSLYVVLVPGLRLYDGWKAFLAGNTIASFAPNPFDVMVRFAMYRAFGVKARDTLASIIIGGSAQTLFSVIAPILALAVFVGTGHGTDSLKVFTEVAVAAAIAVLVLITVALRREELAAWLGRLAQRTVDWLLPKFGRTPPEGLEGIVVDFRRLIVDVIAHRWWSTLSYLIGTHAVRYLGMLILFRQVGIAADEVGSLELLGVYTIGLLVSLIPIVPSGVGAVEFAYIWILAREDEALASLIAAATFSHRIFFWLVPILIGIVPLVQWMRGAHKPFSFEEGLDLRAIAESDAHEGD